MADNPTACKGLLCVVEAGDVRFYPSGGSAATTPANRQPFAKKRGGWIFAGLWHETRPVKWSHLLIKRD